MPKLLKMSRKITICMMNKKVGALTQRKLMRKKMMKCESKNIWQSRICKGKNTRVLPLAHRWVLYQYFRLGRVREVKIKIKTREKK